MDSNNCYLTQGEAQQNCNVGTAISFIVAEQLGGGGVGEIIYNVGQGLQIE